MIRKASERAKKVRRAATVATTDGAIMAFFAAGCLAFGLFDRVSLLLGVGLAIVTYNSFQGAAGLKRFDARAPRRLGWNQVFLATIVILYAIWMLYTQLSGIPAAGSAADPYKEIADLDPAMAKTLHDFSGLFVKIVYLGLIGGTIVAQGLTALYYFSRTRHVQNYLQETPPWAVELQRHQAK